MQTPKLSKVRCDETTGEFTYEIDGECILSIILKELDASDDAFDPQLFFQLSRAFDKMYAHGYWNTKDRVKMLIESL